MKNLDLLSTPPPSPDEDSGIFLGKGTFGSVFRSTWQGQAAVCKVFNKVLFASLFFEEEVAIHRHLALHPHPNLIKMLDENSKERTITLEYGGSNLVDYVNQGFHPDRLATYRFNFDFVVYQLLCGVEHLHKIGLIHRDIKMENILLDPATLHLRIADMGGARKATSPSSDYTPLVVTLNYRAPELVAGNFRGDSVPSGPKELNSKGESVGTVSTQPPTPNPRGIHYGSAIDLWSVGCVVYTLWTGRLFISERRASDMEILMYLFEILGTPDPEEASYMYAEHTPFELPVKPYNPGVWFPSKTFRDQNMSDLLRGLLCYNYDRRFSATRALEFSGLREQFENTCRNPLKRKFGQD